MTATQPAAAAAQPATPKSAYTAWWLLRATAETRDLAKDDHHRAAYARVIEAHSQNVTLRGTYSTAGLCAGLDLILWVAADDLDKIQALALDLDRTAIGRSLALVQVYLGIAAMSQYDPTHGPAFLKGKPPAKFLSVYPFTKTPEWYLLPYEKRRELMKVHGQLGDEFPTILTNTVSSFGIADQEFVVALEDDDPNELVKMVQRLRAAEVRIYTQVDTPIYLGRLKPVAEALSDLA